MTAHLLRCRPHVLAGSLCGGIALADAERIVWPALAGLACLLAAAAAAAHGALRLGLLAAALAAAGVWWGSARLDALDRSVLGPRIGESRRALVVVSGSPRVGAFAVRVPARVRRFDGEAIDEAVLLELPPGRAPAQGEILDLQALLVAPRRAAHGFDERAYLRRHGVHVVVRARSWRVVGRRGGLGGAADRLRAWLSRGAAAGLRGERAAVVRGVVLGDDAAISPDLRDAFRASGLYHLLAVSGQNVALVAGGALGLVWVAGLPRALGHLAALLAIGAYVLAVGAQPSVVRAGVAGALASVAWLVSRDRDRWYVLLLGAAVLLAWNPYALLDAGFQLSFAAVAAIFALYPRAVRWLEGYPLPGPLRAPVALSAACGIATAPVLWAQFHALPLLSIPANALAAPVAAPLLSLGLGAALAAPVWPGLAAALAFANGWCAAYLVVCARAVAAVPFARLSSAGTLAAVGALGVFAWLLTRAPARERRELAAVAALAAALLAAWRLSPVHGP